MYLISNKFYLPLIFLIFLNNLFALEYNINIIQSKIVYKEKGIYACFPNIFTIKDTIIIGFSTRKSSSHYDKEGGGKRYISTDNGSTWYETKQNHIYPGYKNLEGNYTITVPKNWRKINKENLQKKRDESITIKESNGFFWESIGIYQKTINSKGVQISSKTIQLPKHSLLMGTNLSSYHRRDDGARLISLFGKLNNRQKENQIFILQSFDDGKKWTFIKPYSDPGKIGNIGLGETALIETEKNIIIGISRGSDGYLYSSHSKNFGSNWSNPKKMNIWGHPANLIKLNRNLLVCTYGYRKSPIGIRAIILDSETLEFKSKEFILRADGKGNPYDTGYPMTINLKENTFLTCYYFTSADNITHIATTKWEII